jgi:putative FmdB family regulatory protein
VIHFRAIRSRGFAVPLYEYECSKCHHRFEIIEKNTASEIKKCPKCGGRAKRQLSAPAIQFKGTGWYVTDYAKKSGGAQAESSDKSSGKDEKSEKSGKSESGEKSDKSGKSEKSEKSEKKDSKSEKSSSGSSSGSSGSKSSKKD